MSNESMPYRQLGTAGVRVSALSLGGWTTFGGSLTDQAASEAIIRAAFEAGVNFFDIADVYAHGEAERLMGSVLRQLPRHELVISSKVYWPMSDDVNDRGLSRKHIIESVDRSLRRIGVDYLDLYFCHRWDNDTALEETARAMDHLVRQGKVVYWGTSEWSASQLRAAHDLADQRNLYAPVVEQPQYSLLARGKVEQEIEPQARSLGMGLVVWSPLASGVLSGKYDDGVPKGARLERIDWLRERLLVEETLDRVRRFAAIAQEVGCSRAQLALAWALQRPGIASVITGATSLSQLHENLAALKLSPANEVIERIEALFPA